MEKGKKTFNLEINNIKMETNPKVLINDQSIPIEHEMSNQLHVLECIKDAITLDVAQKPHIAWQLIHNMLIALSTEYPTLVHFTIAREALIDEDIKGIDRHSKEYKDIVIQVASSLNEHCQKLKIYLSPPKKLKAGFKNVKASAHKLTGTLSAIDIVDWSEIPSIDSYFEEDKLFFVDNKFLKYLRTIGKEGKVLAENLKSYFHEDYIAFKKSNKYPLVFWFNLQSTPEHPIFFSSAWKSLAKAIWRDAVSRRALLIIKGLPTIIENDQKHIRDMVSHDKKIEHTEKQIQVFSHGSLLGEIHIPTIPEGIMGTILNGINKMKLVEGHRVLRYITRTTFYQAINGEADYRIIRRESFPDIAKELGLKSEISIANMKDVFQAMAYFDFKRPNFSGNLIALRRFKSAKTHRLDGVEITVGTNLLPYRACEDFKSGESKIMIPILSDPLLVRSNKYHAGQYLLQMLVMGEFVRQSMDFFKYRYIKITEESWKKMAQECAVLPILNDILDRWTRDDSDGLKFIEKIDTAFYTLGSSYQKEIDFLIRQGDHKIKQSNRGKASANKRINTKQR